MTTPLGRDHPRAFGRVPGLAANLLQLSDCMVQAKHVLLGAMSYSQQSPPQAGIIPH